MNYERPHITDVILYLQYLTDQKPISCWGKQNE